MIGISKESGKIIGISFLPVLYAMPAIFRERVSIKEMTLMLLGGYPPGDALAVHGDMIEVPEGTYSCLSMEDERDMKVLMSMERVSSLYHLILIDKYCLESPDDPIEGGREAFGMVEEYIAGYYSANERILHEVARRGIVVPSARECPLGTEMIRSDNLGPDDYPSWEDVPKGEYFVNHEDKVLVEAMRHGFFRRMPDEAIDIILRLLGNHRRSICRYARTSPNHAHLCLDDRLRPFGMSRVKGPPVSHGGTQEDNEYLVHTKSFTIALNFLYLRDVIMSMGVVPFDENIVVKNGLEFLLVLRDTHYIDCYKSQRLFDHVYVMRRCSHLLEWDHINTSSSEQFGKKLEEDSEGLFGPSFDWSGFILTGSTIFSLILGTSNHGDYDLIYLSDEATGSREAPQSREALMEVYRSRLRGLPTIGEASILETERSFRVTIDRPGRRGIDLYYGSVRSISRYHSTPTNCYYDGTNVCMYPRALHCLATGIITDFLPLRSNKGPELRKKTADKYPMLFVHTWHKELEDMIDRNPRRGIIPRNKSLRREICDLLHVDLFA